MKMEAVSVFIASILVTFRFLHSERGGKQRLFLQLIRLVTSLCFINLMIGDSLIITRVKNPFEMVFAR